MRPDLPPDALDRVDPLPQASYVVCWCAGELGGAQYYESIDLLDARHPQTLLAYELNDRPCRLPTARRCVCESSVSSATGWRSTCCASGWWSFERIHGGRGSDWADRGYEWFAGI